MWQFLINPVQEVEGEIQVPGDKSISHRSVLFGALTDGKVEIDNFLMGDDCLHTVDFMRGLGVSIQVDLAKRHVTVDGVGFEGLKEPEGVLEVGNAGTLIRIGAGLLAACPFYTVVTGDASIRQRPMKRIVEPLNRMGSKIWGRQGNTLAPLAIQGGKLRGITYSTKTASAQVKSAILLAGLLADKGITVVKEPAPSRDHTERMLRYLGANLKKEGNTIEIHPQKSLKANPIFVPGDISSAAFLMAAGVLKTRSEVIISNVGYNSTRAGMIQALQMMGGKIEVFNQRELNGEPIIDLRILPSKLQGIRLKGDLIPNIIDEIPILVILATQAQGQTTITDAQELRVKESDRIHTIVTGLRKLGIQVEERPDGMVINGPQQILGGVVESFGDHRIAMSLAIAGLCALEPVTVKDTGCVRTSFPGFVETLCQIAGTNSITENRVDLKNCQ